MKVSGREQANLAWKLLLTNGKITREELSVINPKYNGDPIAYLKMYFPERTNKILIERAGRKMIGYILSTGCKGAIEQEQNKLGVISESTEIKFKSPSLRNEQPVNLIELPPWDSSIFQKWAFNFCMSNAWRVRDRLGDIDDCMAQCALYYIECKNFYQHQVNSQKHFMYMYKLWVRGQFDDLAVKDSRNRDTKSNLASKKEAIESPNAELIVKLGEASSELQDVLKIIFNAPNEMIDTLRGDIRSCKKFFKHVVKSIGLSPDKADSLSNELKDLLS